MSARADQASAPSLTISQLKITSSDGQFITLYNSTDQALDMSQYRLEYFNNYDLSKASSSKLISLSGVVPPHGYFMVNDGIYRLCYQIIVDSVSLGLSSTAGLVEVLSFGQNGPGGPADPALQDYVSWSKSSAAGAQTLPPGSGSFLRRQPLDGAGNPVIGLPGAGGWQAVQTDPDNSCELITSSGTSVPTIGFSRLLPPIEPPATIVSVAAQSNAAENTLPAADIGLMSPEVTEVLPNPVGTGNDATDEFIEVYNPNSRAFNLDGFKLQSGLTALHNYSFPPGSVLAPRGFTAFYSAKTGLSLSNSGGQVKLIDPFGNSISATPAYGTAKDGQAWALAKGKWYWTAKPTPGMANIIKQPLSGKKSAASKSKAGKKSKSTGARVASSAAGYNGGNGEAGSTPVHTGVLALVACLALVYGTYEYRADLANYIYRFRRHLKARRADRA